MCYEPVQFTKIFVFIIIMGLIDNSFPFQTLQKIRVCDQN